jgi:hypothetical protein
LGLVPLLAEALAIGAYAVLESVPGHGQNWRELPSSGALARLLAGRFTVMALTERRVGSPHRRAVTVRAFVRHTG